MRFFIIIFQFLGFYDMETFYRNITIKIWGIVNPNRVKNSRTNYFGFGLMDSSGKSIIEGKMDITGVIPLLAPGFFIEFIDIFDLLFIKPKTFFLLILNFFFYSSCIQF
jgi:hypothetical protein